MAQSCRKFHRRDFSLTNFDGHPSFRVVDGAQRSDHAVHNLKPGSRESALVCIAFIGHDYDGSRCRVSRFLSLYPYYITKYRCEVCFPWPFRDTIRLFGRVNLMRMREEEVLLAIQWNLVFSLR